MSSNAFSARLIPEPWARIAVLVGGQLLGVAGCVILLRLAVPRPLRALAILLWIAWLIYELRPLRRAYERYTVIRVTPDGHVELQSKDLDWHPASLSAGSVLLQDVAWLRFKSARDGQFAELLTRRGQNGEDWRRLSVIWRHIGASR